MTSIRPTIGAFFRSHRLRAGITLEAASTHLELSSPLALEAYESGKNDIPVERIFVLANLYDIPPDEVVVLFYELAHISEDAKTREK
jgi:transcriptional regulator with XRE-family HTH domain